MFIAFEGGEGSGKSTQAERLRRQLAQGGFQALLVHEPGTTSLGRYLRSYLKSKRPLTAKAELLLFVAARAQLVEEQIAPALADGITVITDRFAASTVAYQGYGRQSGSDGRDAINFLNDYATGGLTPDVTFLLDIEPEEGLRRATQQSALILEPELTENGARADSDDSRRFEDQSLAFHTRVRSGYRSLAQSGSGWQILDAQRPIDTIARQVWDTVEPLLLPSSSTLAVNPAPASPALL